MGFESSFRPTAAKYLQLHGVSDASAIKFNWLTLKHHSRYPHQSAFALDASTDGCPAGYMIWWLSSQIMFVLMAAIVEVLCLQGLPCQYYWLLAAPYSCSYCVELYASHIGWARAASAAGAAAPAFVEAELAALQQALAEAEDTHAEVLQHPVEMS